MGRPGGRYRVSVGGEGLSTLEASQEGLLMFQADSAIGPVSVELMMFQVDDTMGPVSTRHAKFQQAEHLFTDASVQIQFCGIALLALILTQVRKCRCFCT